MSKEQVINKEMADFMFELPLEVKIAKTEQRIIEWVEEYGESGVYVAFSGGKDSTVLLHIARSLYPNIKGMFCNTGLEFPEIVQFVNTIENIDVVKPKMTFKQVLEKYGYPIISKEQSQYINQYRTHKSEKTKHTRWFGNKWGQGKISEKWKFVTEAPFMVSDQCCNIMKKNPSKQYEKENKVHPILGTMASESSQRRVYWYKNGCNGFDLKRPTSKPLSFWKEEDIWAYIKKFDIPYSKIYDMGYERTGCMFCMYGCHKDASPTRFEMINKTHPKIYDYCMEKLGLRKIFEWMNEHMTKDNIKY